MNTFSKIIVALIAAAATFAAAAVLIGRYADKRERRRLHSDVRGKLQIAKLRKKPTLKKIEEAFTDAIEDLRDEDEPDVIVIDLTEPEDTASDTSDEPKEEGALDWDFDFDIELPDDCN